MTHLGTPKLLTRGEAAAVLGMEPAAVTRLADRGDLLPVRTPGGHRRYRADDVNRLATSRVTPTGKGVTRDAS